MDNNLNILLKTENGDSVETNDIQEDPFKYSKYKIKNICRALWRRHQHPPGRQRLNLP